MQSFKKHFLGFPLLIGAIASSLGSAFAQEFTSPPSGREVLTVRNGFNYHGLRFHRSPVASGNAVLVTTGSSTITVEDGIADSLTSGTNYIFEVDSGNGLGIVVEVTAFDATLETITLSDDISPDFADGDQFTIRPAATLSTIFGAQNSAGLDEGQGGSAGADSVWIPNGSGGFSKYYYFVDPFFPGNNTWKNENTGQAIDPDDVSLFYPEGIVIVGRGVANNTYAVTGILKLSKTNYALVSSLNYLSSLSPTGGTLESMFGAENSAGLDEGAGGPAGADSVWVPDGLGGFDKYYYSTDPFFPGNEFWRDLDSNQIIDPSSISLDSNSGFIINNEGGNQSVTALPPSFYSTL